MSSIKESRYLYLWAGCITGDIFKYQYQSYKENIMNLKMYHNDAGLRKKDRTSTSRSRMSKAKEKI